MRRRRGAGSHERGFKSLIVVTSNYHMPRAIVELSHAMPDIKLIPFAVVGEKWRDEPWWTSGATLRLLLSEYVKYVAAEVRVRLADAGLDLTPELADQPAGSLPPRTAGDGASQLIGFSMVSIFLRSLVYNVLFYLLLVFWMIVAIPTFLMPRWAIMTIARLLGAQQHLADARGLQHQGGISRAREDSGGAADRRLETSVDVGNLRAAAVFRSSRCSSSSAS